MDWFDDLTNKVSNAWSDVVDTGSQYVSGTWETKKEQFLSGEETSQENVAAIPNAQPSTETGTGTASTGSGFNWQAAGVLVGVAGILIKVLK